MNSSYKDSSVDNLAKPWIIFNSETNNFQDGFNLCNKDEEQSKNQVKQGHRLKKRNSISSG